MLCVSVAVFGIIERLLCMVLQYVRGDCSSVRPIGPSDSLLDFVLGQSVDWVLCLWPWQAMCCDTGASHVADCD